MDKKGNWRLSPAYNLNYSYNPRGKWTNTHQMMINGKRDNFTRKDFIELGKFAGIKKSKTENYINRTIDVFKKWEEYASFAEVEQSHIVSINRHLRLDI